MLVGDRGIEGTPYFGRERSNSIDIVPDHEGWENELVFIELGVTGVRLVHDPGQPELGHPEVVGTNYRIKIFVGKQLTLVAIRHSGTERRVFDLHFIHRPEVRFCGIRQIGVLCVPDERLSRSVVGNHSFVRDPIGQPPVLLAEEDILGPDRE